MTLTLPLGRIPPLPGRQMLNLEYVCTGQLQVLRQVAAVTIAEMFVVSKDFTIQRALERLLRDVAGKVALNFSFQNICASPLI